MSLEEKEGGIENPAFVKEENASQGDLKTVLPLEKGVPTEVIGPDDPLKIKEDQKKEKFKILKNIVIISMAFIFNFTAYNSMANLQSSINPEVGTAALSTLYAALVVSCCFVPAWMIKLLKEKNTIALCILGYTSYIAAQFYPEYYTLVPTAILVGFAAAPMWSAKCTYLTKVGSRYAEIIGEDPEVIITRFFGIFFFFFQTTQVWGNLITSTVLSSGVEPYEKTEEDLMICGYDFCPWYNISNGNSSSEIPDWQMYTMSSIYLVFSLVASLIIFIFIDPLETYKHIDSSNTSNQGRSGMELLLATFNHMRHPYQLLIIPLTIWSGVEQGFLGADLTAAYVSCGLGVQMIGYVLICYGVCDVFGSISFTPLVKIIGRVPVFILGFAVNLGVIITLIYWKPDPDQPVVFFALAGLWGVSDAIWQTQINAFYGVIFPGESEVAFSNYRLWESVGFIISYAFSTVSCIDDKVTTLLVFISLGIVGYLIIEILEKGGKLKKDSEGKVVPFDKLVRGKYS